MMLKESQDLKVMGQRVVWREQMRWVNILLQNVLPGEVRVNTEVLKATFVRVK